MPLLKNKKGAQVLLEVCGEKKKTLQKHSKQSLNIIHIHADSA